MQTIKVGGVALHVEDRGGDGPALVFGNSLGTDFRLWNPIVDRYADWRVIRYDMRGHGLSDCPPGPYTMDQLVDDAAGVMDALGVSNAVFVGLSVGGIVAQGLATRRPDLLRAAVLSNTAARLGTHEMWQARIDAVKAGGIAAISDSILERWFAADFFEHPDFPLWRHMLVRTPSEGYAAMSAAIKETDFTEATSKLTLPVLGIAGSEDGAATPEVVKATIDSIAGAQYALIDGAGHLPCVEAPDRYAEILTEFLQGL